MQAPLGGRQGERVAKMPFRPMRLASFRAGEFGVFSPLPSLGRPGPFLLSILGAGTSQGSVSVVCNSLSAGRGWPSLEPVGVWRSDLALSFEIYPLLFFFFFKNQV